MFTTGCMACHFSPVDTAKSVSSMLRKVMLGVAIYVLASPYKSKARC